MKSHRSQIGERDPYDRLLGDLTSLLGASRHHAVRAVNACMTAAYWSVGRRIVQFEQDGDPRAPYGEKLLTRLSEDLTRTYGRGFTRPCLQRMRQFYLAYPESEILLDTVEQISSHSGPACQAPPPDLVALRGAPT